jgi:ataxia telangiectasia mutated family protein
LEVFLHDPLYKWALSTEKLQKLRREDRATSNSGAASGPAGDNIHVDDDAAAAAAVAAAGDESKNRTTATVGGGRGGGGGNVGAQRAMFHVKQKLRGEERNAALSVEGQVRSLVIDAMDMDNLAMMYYGWAPWV